MSGNPLATYLAMSDLEEEYLKSPIFSGIYPEVKANFEQFLGVPGAGLRAMSLPVLRQSWLEAELADLEEYHPESALRVVAEQASSTQIVIWAEEHHLPQTRSLYEPLLKALWTQGYRYLAAETFVDDMASDSDSPPDYGSGYYLRDPVFAHAVRVAQELGYALVPYDTKESGELGDTSFRDRRQAENIHDRVFANDPSAKVIVFAGRGHASEQVASDGWTPMGYVLSQLTGIDPLTLYAPTMSERQTREEEHPLYRHAVSNGLVVEPVVFLHDETQKLFGTSSFDAYIFWPRTEYEANRPDWLSSTLHRHAITIPESLRSDGIYLVQAFYQGDAPSVIPVDQIIVDGRDNAPALMLPSGQFWIRSIDRFDDEIGRANLNVPQNIEANKDR